MTMPTRRGLSAAIVIVALLSLVMPAVVAAQSPDPIASLADQLTGIARQPWFVAIYVSVILSFANLIAGSLRAVKNESFHAPAWKSWIKSDGAEIGLFSLWIVLGQAIGLVDTSIIGLPSEVAAAPLIGYGLLQAVTFIVSELASLKNSIQPPSATVLQAKVARAEAAGDSVPGVTAKA